MSQNSWNIKSILDVSADYLDKKGIETPRLCAEVLLAYLLDASRVSLYLHFDQPLNEQEIAGYRSLIKRRVNREPTQYITGIQEFWSLDFKVGPSVLIPRADSEILIEQAVSLSKQGQLNKSGALQLLDLGTGCGALAISLAREFEMSRVWASDISGEALRVAQINAQKHGVADRIEFKLGDMWEPFMKHDIQFDMIVTNPPYIASEAIASLPREVREHEPLQALDGFKGGMFYIERIIREGIGHLKPGGWLLMEMDPHQNGKALRQIEKTMGYINAKGIRDYSRQYRVVIVQKENQTVQE
ncbi:peptide chain release factor N(5)-glutamine methyltransferase [Thermodesulfobacteriota bacterium]